MRKWKVSRNFILIMAGLAVMVKIAFFFAGRNLTMESRSEVVSVVVVPQVAKVAGEAEQEKFVDTPQMGEVRLTVELDLSTLAKVPVKSTNTVSVSDGVGVQ